MRSGLYSKRESDYESIRKVFTAFSHVFPRTLENEESRSAYARKIEQHGFMFSVYLEDELMGFYCGYANDMVTKRAFGTLIHVKPDIGLLSGRVLGMLVSEAVSYSKAQGMETLYGEVYDDNVHAQKIYARLGATSQGRASENSSFMAISLNDLRWGDT